MIISKNSNYYIYKYIKYKNKYINLKNNYQQDGGEVLSIISKSNFETVFNLDFDSASDLAVDSEIVFNSELANDSVEMHI